MKRFLLALCWLACIALVTTPAMAGDRGVRTNRSDPYAGYDSGSADRLSRYRDTHVAQSRVIHTQPLKRSDRRTRPTHGTPTNAAEAQRYRSARRVGRELNSSRQTIVIEDRRGVVRSRSQGATVVRNPLYHRDSRARINREAQTDRYGVDALRHRQRAPRIVTQNTYPRTVRKTYRSYPYTQRDRYGVVRYHTPPAYLCNPGLYRNWSHQRYARYHRGWHRTSSGVFLRFGQGFHHSRFHRSRFRSSFGLGYSTGFGSRFHRSGSGVSLYFNF